jgi:hypothetical protein
MEKFTQLFASIAIVTPIITSCNFFSKNTIHGNYHVVSKEIHIADYDEISVALRAHVVYQQFSDSTPYLQINTDDNLLDLLDIRVESGKLIIATKPDFVIRPTQFTIYTNSRNLKKAHVSGSGDLYLRGEVNAENFDLNVAGSGTIHTDSLLCSEIKVKVSGSGTAQLIGAAKDALYMVSGSGDINAFEFLTQILECNVSGSGSINAYPTEKLDAWVSGSGNIRYKGLPEFVNTSVSGSGNIRRIE